MSAPASLKGHKLEPMYGIWPQIVELVSLYLSPSEYENKLSNVGQVIKELTF